MALDQEQTVYLEGINERRFALKSKIRQKREAILEDEIELDKLSGEYLRILDGGRPPSLREMPSDVEEVVHDEGYRGH